MICDGIIFGPLHAVDASPLNEDPAEVRSADRPRALDMYNTTRSFTHESVGVLILGYIDLLSCIRSLPTSFRPSLCGAQGLGTAPERRRCKKIAEGGSVLIHCGFFERTTDHVRQHPP